MSDDYISREAAVKIIRSIHSPSCFSGDAISRTVAYCEVKDLPAADVKPVVRGEWINRNAAFMECSACHALYLKQINSRLGKAYWANPNFCPNCGADMRRRKEGGKR